MKRFGRIFSLAVLTGLIGATAWVWINRQDVYDWFRLRDYTAPPPIAQLATDTTMNDDTRRLFYVQHPELNNRAQFNRHCGGISEATIVLGCYISGQGIYIFDVDDDPRLSGVEQVTTAHELLHAAYDRLSEKERSRIDLLTQQAFENLTDNRIRQNIASYHDRDPSVIPNELHSILGTEVRHLPAELENYYKRYFTNRAQIVAYSERYEGELTRRRNHAASLELQIAGLKTDIEQLESSLQTERAALAQERSNVTTQEQVATFNARVDAYNANVGHLNDLIQQHNALVEEYKANAVEQQELFEALSSQPTL